MVVITCQKNSILPRAITTNRCGKARSKEEVRRKKEEGRGKREEGRGKKVEGNDRTTGLQDYGLRDELCDGAERREMGSGRTADCPPRRAQSSLLFPVIRM